MAREFDAPLPVRWARFGPEDRRWFCHVPRGGVCLSVFLFVRNRAGKILLGRPRLHRDWPEKGCLPTWRLRPLVREGRWILPASHLLMHEAPDHAARRVLRDWGGGSGRALRLVSVESEVFGPGPKVGRSRRASPPHWAVAFLYECRTDAKPRLARGWSELRFVPLDAPYPVPIGRDHADLIRAYRRRLNAE